MIQHSSDGYEHYTQMDIAQLVHEVMGDIDLDPASCELANQQVGASAWYGPGSPLGEDGLLEPWMGRVYLNPPGGALTKEEMRMFDAKTTSRAAIWWAKLAEAWTVGDVEEAIFMGFTLEILRTVQSLSVTQPMMLPFCIPASRLPFGTNNREYEKGRKKGQLINPNEPEGSWVLQKQPAHANVIVYLPPHQGDAVHTAVEKFASVFSQIGLVRI